jgi:5-methylthioadenosine/S-adenosylhomocysteine deaminase
MQLKSRVLIQNGAVLTMDESGCVHRPGWVLTEADKILKVGTGTPTSEIAGSANRIIDARGMAVIPGLINGHTHLSQSFMRGLAEGKQLLDWLKSVTGPFRRAMTAHDVYLASLLGLVENLQCGSTSIVQHHKITTTHEHVDATALAAEKLGIRMLLARGWRDIGDSSETPEKILFETLKTYERWHCAAEGRITIGIGPTAPWRCSDSSIRKTNSLARSLGLPTHIHVGETRTEIDSHRQRTGLGHIEWLKTLDALGPNTQLVHCIWISDYEIDLIAESRAVVVHCPVSNMYLASGAAPVRRMLDRGVAVALGTDGSASNNSQDMFETLKVASLLAKVSTGNAAALPPLETLRMATTSGAWLFGSQKIGRLAAGFKADITLVNLNTARSVPIHNFESALVYNASGPDVHTVLVDGRILLDNGRVTVLDEEILFRECDQAAKRLIRRVGRVAA